jgi:adenosylcobyric acid synthase
MVQGTASSVGKSVIAAALCRIFKNDGLSVAPFKAQNMSNNSFVAPDGGELGRAQALQAAACKIPPEVAMNPVLLKPEADHRSQAVVMGRPMGSLSSQEWRTRKIEFWSAVTNSLASLLDRHDIVVIEGAGSPAEVNIKDSDIVNMRVAMHSRAPVLLVGDIDRGGVFASLLGTVQLLESAERKLIRGLIINRFRGDRAVLEPLPSMIAERTGVPVAGVVPFLPDMRLPEEDAVALYESEARTSSPDDFQVAVIRLPRVSNFDDVDPLRHTPGVTVRFVSEPADLADAHLIVIPGTKSTISDLRWMRSRNLHTAVQDATSKSVPVIGICGGYQLLGDSINDPEGVDGEKGATESGLGLLPVTTVFHAVKDTRQVTFELQPGAGLLADAAGTPGAGYEIHMGETSAIEPDSTPVLSGGNANRGTASFDGRVLGTYVHGFFDSQPVRQRILANVARLHGIRSPETVAFSLDAEIDRLAMVVRENLDMDLVYSLIGRDAPDMKDA